MVITIVGFILTSILGTVFSFRLNEVIRKADFDSATRQRALQVIREAADLVNERRTRAVLVSSAIRRGAIESETKARKEAYDDADADAYVRWNTKWDGIGLQVRSILHRYFPQGDVADRLADQMYSFSWHQLRGDPETHPGTLSIMDDCITKAYDQYRSTEFKNKEEPVKALEHCNFSEINQSALKCIDKLIGTLYFVIDTLDVQHEIDIVSRNLPLLEDICHLQEPSAN